MDEGCAEHSNSRTRERDWFPEANAIDLTQEERSELEGFARSTRTQHRLHQRARIVLLASDSMATRAIGREVG